MFKGYILSFLLIGSILSSDADNDSHDFRYPSDDEDDANYTWGGKCDSGHRQSPIEIITQDAERIKSADLQYEGYNNGNVGKASIVNNGHTINIHKFEQKMSVSGGVLEENKYILDQIHFHWPSEHVIDDKRYSLEMHLVHYEDDYKNITSAQQKRGGILVLAVRFQAGGDADANPTIDKIFKNNIIEKIDDDKEMNINFEIDADFDIQDLLPQEVDDKYFYYVGSLTTPPCTESVHWIVFEDLQEVSLKQLDIFDNIEDKDGVKIPKNNRALQRTGQRHVYYVEDNEGSKDDNKGLNEADKLFEDENDKKIHKEQEAHEKHDDDDDAENSSSLRYSVSPITILLASILTIIGSVTH